MNGRLAGVMGAVICLAWCVQTLAADGGKILIKKPQIRKAPTEQVQQQGSTSLPLMQIQRKPMSGLSGAVGFVPKLALRDWSVKCTIHRDY